MADDVSPRCSVTLSGLAVGHIARFDVDPSAAKVRPVIETSNITMRDVDSACQQWLRFDLPKMDLCSAGPPHGSDNTCAKIEAPPFPSESTPQSLRSSVCVPLRNISVALRRAVAAPSSSSSFVRDLSSRRSVTLVPIPRDKEVRVGSVSEATTACAIATAVTSRKDALATAQRELCAFISAATAFSVCDVSQSRMAIETIKTTAKMRRTSGMLRELSRIVSTQQAQTLGLLVLKSQWNALDVGLVGSGQKNPLAVLCCTIDNACQNKDGTLQFKRADVTNFREYRGVIEHAEEIRGPRCAEACQLLVAAWNSSTNGSAQPEEVGRFIALTEQELEALQFVRGKFF